MKKIKNKNILIIVLSLALFCLISVGIYSYVNYVRNNKDGYETLNVNSEQVKDLIYLTRGNHNSTLFFGTKYYNMYYSEDVIKTSELNEDFKKLLSYYTLDASLLDYSTNNTVFNADDLKVQYINIFGNDKDYIDEDIYCNCPSKIIYLPSSKEYVIGGAYGMQILEGYNSKITEARKYKAKIEIYEKVVFYEEDEDAGKVNYYRDYKDGKFSTKITEISSDKQFNFDDYSKQYNTYKYTFILQNDSYYFDSVERMK